MSPVERMASLYCCNNLRKRNELFFWCALIFKLLLCDLRICYQNQCLPPTLSWPCKSCVHSQWIGPLITFLTIMPFSKRSELSPNMLRILREENSNSGEFCFSVTKIGGEAYSKSKSRLFQVTSTAVKYTDGQLLLRELWVNLMAKNFRYFRKNHFGNTSASTGHDISLSRHWPYPGLNNKHLCFCFTLHICIPTPGPLDLIW